MVNDADEVAPLPSVTLTVKPEVPVPLGVPEMAPEEDSDSPSGRLPEVSAQV